MRCKEVFCKLRCLCLLSLLEFTGVYWSILRLFGRFRSFGGAQGLVNTVICG